MSDVSKKLDTWEPVIGLEVHAQLSTGTKMFCGCKNVYGDSPNTHTCPVCLGLPGSLPAINEKAIRYALRLGLALGCQVTRFSRFARKNYFYPDLPKGYQISQYEEPLCQGGSVITRQNGHLVEIPLIRIHLEEDAGKSIHAARGDSTAVDFNRCGVPLVEIVSQPVIRTPEEARVYLTRLKQVLEYLDICDCNMEEGNLRCDANISVRRRGEKTHGVKTEMKNLNSFRSVERGLRYEIERQIEVLEKGEDVEHVTLLWNETLQQAEVMRAKEEAHDYRYFPDPDLVPVVVSDRELSRARETLPELPHEKEDRFVESYGLRLEDAAILASNVHLSDYYEKTVGLGADPGEAAKWTVGEMMRILKEKSLDAESFPVRPDRFAALLNLVKQGGVNANTAKDILEKMLTIDLSPADIVEAEGLAQVSDRDQLQEIIDQVIGESPSEVTRYQQGKKSLMGYFMGEVMRRTEGKSDPKIVRSLLSQSLEK